MSERIMARGLGIKALKSSHYADTTTAIAEIIDNSVDAKAQNIYVVFFVDGKETRAPVSIAVLDDGEGMEKDDLRRSVQFGYTEHENSPQGRKTLGRFGVGLLSASLNQCNELNIWSWKNGLDQEGSQFLANKISVDVDEIIETDNDDLPEVLKSPLPEKFMEALHGFSNIQKNPISGTLVEWRKFDNLTWKKASTLCDKVKEQCGRVYRNHIASGRLKIVMLVFNTIDDQVTKKALVPAIDPMFLRAWDDKDLNEFSNTEPMFGPFLERSREDGTLEPIRRTVNDDQGNKIGEYRLLFSYRRKGVVVERAKELNHSDPGNAPFGKLADKLKGVSVLREGRELKLDPFWLRADYTIDRWIKASVDFDSSLDEIFGVTNNKQEAIYLASLAKTRLKELESGDFDGAHNEHVLKVAIEIQKALAVMRNRVKEEQKDKRAPKGKETRQFLEEVSTGELQGLGKLAEERAKDNPIVSDKEKSDPNGFVEAYKGTCHRGQDATVVRPDVVRANKLKVDFVSSDEDLGAPIFDVREKNGIMMVIFNRDHPLYARILEALALDNGDEANGSSKIETIQKQLDASIWVIQRLFYSFARAEREAQGNARDEFQQVRLSWGRLAKFVLKNEDE